MEHNRAYQQSFNKLIFLIAVVWIAHFQGYSQNEYKSFYDQSLATQNTGMYILGGWAIANIATVACGGYLKTGALLWKRDLKTNNY